MAIFAVPKLGLFLAFQCLAAAHFTKIAILAGGDEGRLPEGESGVEEFVDGLSQKAPEVGIKGTEIFNNLPVASNEGGIIVFENLLYIDERRHNGATRRGLPQEGGGVKEGLEDVGGSIGPGLEKFVDGSTVFGSASGFVVENVAGAVFFFQPVDDAPDVQANVVSGAGNGAANVVFEAEKGERGSFFVEADQSVQHFLDYLQVEELFAVEIGLVDGSSFKVLFAKGL